MCALAVDLEFYFGVAVMHCIWGGKIVRVDLVGARRQNILKCGENLREKTLQIGRKWASHGENFHGSNALVGQCGRPKISWRKLSHVALIVKLRNLWKFSPLKVSCYAVYKYIIWLQLHPLLLSLSLSLSTSPSLYFISSHSIASSLSFLSLSSKAKIVLFWVFLDPMHLVYTNYSSSIFPGKTRRFLWMSTRMLWTCLQVSSYYWIYDYVCSDTF